MSQDDDVDSWPTASRTTLVPTCRVAASPLPSRQCSSVGPDLRPLVGAFGVMQPAPKPALTAGAPPICPKRRDAAYSEWPLVFVVGRTCTRRHRFRPPHIEQRTALPLKASGGGGMRLVYRGLNHYGCLETSKLTGGVRSETEPVRVSL